MAEITLMSDERVAAIPVANVGEPFADLRRLPGLLLDDRLADRLGAYAHVRAGVADASGATAVLGSRPVAAPCVVVDDVVTALTELAVHVRKRLSPIVIGLTGSVGKTTTKDLLAQILEREGPTVATARSYNNEIGLPLTVLRADRDTRQLVLERRGS